MLTAIVGTNWGDEGKGRMVDLLSADYDVVVRYQGGNNAGHTVVNDLGKFVMNLLPSGILRPETANLLGPGMVVDLEHLYGEVNALRAAGIRAICCSATGPPSVCPITSCWTGWRRTGWATKSTAPPAGGSRRSTRINS